MISRPRIDFDTIFQGGHVPPWLRRFAVEPDSSLDDLLTGRAALGLLSAAEPDALLVGWLRDIGNTGGFAEAVDETLSDWIARSWGQPLLPSAADATITSVAWCRVCEVIAVVPVLIKSADMLRERVLAEPLFLDSLTEGRACDPLGRAYFALAEFQSDRRLLDHWWQLVKLPPDQPWYRGAYGVRGLVKLPQDSPVNRGKWNEEPALGLRQLGFHLQRLQQEGFLEERVASDEFLRTARMTMRSLPFADRWQSFWRDAAEDRHMPLREDWLRKLVPQAKQPQKRKTRQLRPNPEWRSSLERIVAKLKAHDYSALSEAEQLLDEQRRYAEATGDVYFVVRTACNFASRIRKADPGRAVQWTELARQFDPWNPHTWNEGTEALRSAGRSQDAVRLVLRAVQRFPDDVFARNGLAEALREAGKGQEAEQVYRETIERFPDNVVARNGLAEALREAGNLQEAEQVYRETIERFPDNAVARNGLAEALREAGKRREAEQVYRETIERFPDNVVAPCGLAETLRAASRSSEAEQVYRETIRRFPHSVTARCGLALTLHAKGRLVEAEHIYVEVLRKIAPNDPYATSGLADIRQEMQKRSDALVAQPEKTALHGDAAKSAAKEQAATAEDRTRETSQDMSTPSQGSARLEPDVIANQVPPSLTDMDVATVLSDAYLLRRWGSRKLSTQVETHGQRRVEARELLERLRPWLERNASAAQEAALLQVTAGQWNEAVNLLREAVRRFPRHQRLQYAWARALREQAAQQQRRHSLEAERELLTPWKRLAKQAPYYRPVSLLGEGRAWLALTDGGTVEDHAREAFGRLGHWVLRHLESKTGELEVEAAKEEHAETTFTRWWAGEVSRWLFNDAPPHSADELGDLTIIRKQLTESPGTFDQLEEDWVFRHAPA